MGEDIVYEAEILVEDMLDASCQCRTRNMRSLRGSRVPSGCSDGSGGRGRGRSGLVLMWDVLEVEAMIPRDVNELAAIDDRTRGICGAGT